MTDWDRNCTVEACMGSLRIWYKAKLGTNDLSQFTVDNIIRFRQDTGYGELPEGLGQQALDNYFDMHQG